MDVASKLTETGKCSFSKDEDLGFDPEGRPYLGHYSISRNHIAISSLIAPPDLRFTFTCAHEFGHYYLHRKVDYAALIQEGAPEIRDSSRELVAHRTQGLPARSRMEVQANRFAASILLPRVTVPAAVGLAQSKLGISRLGRIWLDDQRHNQRDYHAVVERLSSIYKVSQAVVRYRLEELSLVDTAKNYRLQPIGEMLGSALRDLFRERANGYTG